MVEVFITNVDCAQKAETVLQEFEIVFPGYNANFDLEDCDKILRIEGENINTESVIKTLNKNNIECKILE